jgi:hypothetical protein
MDQTYGFKCLHSFSYTCQPCIVSLSLFVFSLRGRVSILLRREINYCRQSDCIKDIYLCFKKLEYFLFTLLEGVRPVERDKHKYFNKKKWYINFLVIK